MNKQNINYWKASVDHELWDDWFSNESDFHINETGDYIDSEGNWVEESYVLGYFGDYLSFRQERYDNAWKLLNAIAELIKDYSETEQALSIQQFSITKFGQDAFSIIGGPDVAKWIVDFGFERVS